MRDCFPATKIHYITLDPPIFYGHLYHNLGKRSAAPQKGIDKLQRGQLPLRGKSEHQRDYGHSGYGHSGHSGSGYGHSGHSGHSGYGHSGYGHSGNHLPKDFRQIFTALQTILQLSLESQTLKLVVRPSCSNQTLT